MEFNNVTDAIEQLKRLFEAVILQISSQDIVHAHVGFFVKSSEDPQKGPWAGLNQKSGEIHFLLHKPYKFVRVFAARSKVFGIGKIQSRPLWRVLTKEHNDDYAEVMEKFLSKLLEDSKKQFKRDFGSAGDLITIAFPPLETLSVCSVGNISKKEDTDDGPDMVYIDWRKEGKGIRVA